MICEDYGPLLVAYLHDELEPAEREQVQRHIETCDACRSRLAAYRQVRAALGAWEPIRPSPQAEVRLFEQVHQLAGQRGGRTTGLLRRLAGWGLRGGRWPFLSVAAAMVLVASAVAVLVATSSQPGRLATQPGLYDIAARQSDQYDSAVEQQVSLQRAVAEAGFPVLVPESLPPGVTFDTAILRAEPEGGHQVELRWRRAEGEQSGASIALRQIPRHGHAPLAGKRGGEEVVVDGRAMTVVREPQRIVLIWFESDKQVVLEGHGVDEAELLQVAVSLRPAQR